MDETITCETGVDTFLVPSSDAFFVSEINEKIEIWQKNRQAIFDLAGLLHILKAGGAGTVSGDPYSLEFQKIYRIQKLQKNSYINT